MVDQSFHSDFQLIYPIPMVFALSNPDLPNGVIIHFRFFIGRFEFHNYQSQPIITTADCHTRFSNSISIIKNIISRAIFFCRSFVLCRLQYCDLHFFHMGNLLSDFVYHLSTMNSFPLLLSVLIMLRSRSFFKYGNKGFPLFHHAFFPFETYSVIILLHL